jgi:hypothetical protein
MDRVCAGFIAERGGSVAPARQPGAHDETQSRIERTMELVMNRKTSIDSTMTAISAHRRLDLFLAVALLTLACGTTFADGGRDRDGDRDRGYVQTNLISDLPGVALLQDTNLVNAWGISFSAGPNGEGDGLFGALDPAPEKKPDGDHNHGHGHDKH